jgi:hypothetical protein
MFFDHISIEKYLKKEFTVLFHFAAGNIPIYCVLAEFVGVALFQFLGAGSDANSVTSGFVTRTHPFVCGRGRARNNPFSGGQ